MFLFVCAGKNITSQCNARCSTPVRPSRAFNRTQQGRRREARSRLKEKNRTMVFIYFYVSSLEAVERWVKDERLEDNRAAVSICVRVCVCV